METMSAGDVAGAETLEIMASAARYNAWQYEVIAPYIGCRVLEVGSGIGNISGHLVAADHELVVLTDMDEWYREQLRQPTAAIRQSPSDPWPCLTMRPHSCSPHTDSIPWWP